MSEPRIETRPPQVLWGGCLAAVAAALLAVSVFDALDKLHSLATRATMVHTLNGLGLDGPHGVGPLIPVVHVILLVAGCAAAVATILAGFTLTGHVRARIGLTVAAAAAVVSILGSFMGSSVVLSAMLAAAVGMLWSGPARDWFAGRPVREWKLPTPPERSAQGPAQSPFAPPASHGYGAPGRQNPGHQPDHDSPGWGGPPTPPPAPTADRPSQAPAPYPGFGQPTAHTYPVQIQPYVPPRPGVRPSSVVTAALITWVMSAITGLFGVMGALELLFERAALVRSLHSAPVVAVMGHVQVTNAQLTLLEALCLVVVVLSVAAAVLMFFAFHRHEWARASLAACGVFGIVLSIWMTVVGLPVVIAISAAIALLYGAPASHWFRTDPETPTGPRPSEREHEDHTSTR